MKNGRTMAWKRITAGMALGGLMILSAPAADIPPFTDITPAQAAALIKEKGTCPQFAVIDVRTPQEFAESRIAGALNIDLRNPDFKERIGKLNPEGTYLAYCRGGVRSARAMEEMKGLGFKQVYNLAGGLMAWQAKNLPVETAPVQGATMSAPSFRPDTTPYSWVGGQKRTVIPFRRFHNRVHIEAEFNGRQKMDLILDTGMPAPGVLLFDSQAIQALNLTYSGEARVGGAGGGFTSAKVAQGLTMKFGDLLLQGQTAIVQPDAPAAPPSESSSLLRNLGANGVVGNALFNRFIVAIDYDRMLITLSEPGDFSYQGAGRGIPIDFISGFPFIGVNAQLEDGNPLSLLMTLDIGASHALSLNLASQPGIILPRKSVELWGQGIGPEIKGRVGRIKSLAIGPFVLNDVLASFYATKLVPIEKAGNLGGDVLRRFNLIFDYSRRVLIVEPNSSYKAPFEYNMSGFQSRPTGPQEFTVSHLLADSPATEAGLLEGDRIVEVNGRPAGSVSPEELSAWQKREGEILKLVIRRGSQVFTAELKLRRLI